MKMKGTLGDLTAFTAGYATVAPDGDLLSGVNNLLLTATGLSQDTTNEIVRMVVSLLFAILSRAVYAWLDKKFGKAQPQLEVQKPNIDEKESKQKDSYP